MWRHCNRDSPENHGAIDDDGGRWDADGEGGDNDDNGEAMVMIMVIRSTSSSSYSYHHPCSFSSELFS